MDTGAQRRRRRRFGASGSRVMNRRHQLSGDDEVDAFSEEGIAQRPEVRTINKYVLGRTYVWIGLKTVGALALLWATVVLLGGFVSVLKKRDFWFLTSIAFLHAAGLANAERGDPVVLFVTWGISLQFDHITLLKFKLQDEHSLWKIFKMVISLIATNILVPLILLPVMYLVALGPAISIALSVIRLRERDYDSADGDASKANLKRALDLFYWVSLVHGAACILVSVIQNHADFHLLASFSQRHGFSPKVIGGYFRETKRMCINNLASIESWNLITYGAGLLDSELPEDYASGVRVVDALIKHDIPVRQLLIRSPGHRIQKLLRALVWRSPVEGETRRLAARIVEHIAGDLNLAQFPEASECVSSLLDTSFLDNESSFPTTLLDTSPNFNGNKVLQHLIRHWQARMKSFLSVISRPDGEGGEEKEEEEEGKVQEVLPGSVIQTLTSLGRRMGKEHVDVDAEEGTNEDLILQGLRILENLATDQHNCAVIYNTKGLISKITAPVSSNRLTQGIEINDAWIQVVDTSLKVVSRLIRGAGETGREMCRQIADTPNAVRNLESVMRLQSSSSCILELQMRAMEVLAELFIHGSTSWARKRRENFIKRALHIFLTVEWVRYYLAEEKKIKIDEMKEAMETVSRLKEKAGEALAMLSMGSQSNSETILHAYSQTPRSVQRLTKMMCFKTIECKINETETVEAEMKIGCRINAAVILKHLCPHLTTVDGDYVRNTTLKKVLVDLLHVTTESQAQESSTIALHVTTESQAQESSTIVSTLLWLAHYAEVRRNDIENARDRQEEQIQSHKQQPEERKLQAVLLSLCADMCAKYSIKAPDLTAMVAPQVSREDFVRKLTKMVEKNSHATPACLAILKLTCQMVTELILDNQTNEAMETKKTITGMMSQVVAKLSKASKMMAKIESCMLFADSKVDYYGVPVKPLLSVLVKQAEEHLERKKK